MNIEIAVKHKGDADDRKHEECEGCGCSVDEAYIKECPHCHATQP